MRSGINRCFPRIATACWPVRWWKAWLLRRGDARGRRAQPPAAVEGTFLGRRHTDPGVGEPESFRPKDGGDDQRPGRGGRNGQADWKGQPRSNDTHASTTDPDARSYRKSHNTASILCYQGHVLMENRNGLVVSAVVAHAQDGFGERRAALAMLDALPGTGRRSIGADKAYDTEDFVAACGLLTVARARYVISFETIARYAESRPTPAQFLTVAS